MKNVDSGPMRFFDALEMIRSRFDFAQSGCQWMTYAEIAKEIGVPETKGSMVQIGSAMKKLSLKTRRTSRSRHILMPPAHPA